MQAPIHAYIQKFKGLDALKRIELYLVYISLVMQHFVKYCFKVKRLIKTVVKTR